MRNKNRGFTLIELISVIVIIGVLALIATPIVLNYVEQAKIESYEAGINNMIDTLNKYLSSNEGVQEIPKEGILIPENKIYENLGLKNADYIQGKIIKNDKGVIYVENVSNGVYCATGIKNELEIIKGSCEKLDADAPKVDVVSGQITSDSITVVVNGEDEDSGIVSYEYYIVEHIEGKAPSYEEEKGKTDNNTFVFKELKPSTSYDIKVTVVDLNGNTASKEIVIKTNVSTITFSSTPDGWSKAKTVTINYPEKLETQIYQYKINNNDGFVNVDKNSVTVLLTTKSTIIAQVVNADGSVVVEQKKYYGQIDITAPTNVSINGNSTNWTTSKKIEVSAKDTESGIQQYSFDGGKTWQKENYIVLSQNQTLNIVVRDNVGNDTPSEQVVVNKVDSTIPQKLNITAKISGNNYTAGTWTNQNVTLYANPTPESILSGYKYQWYLVGGSYTIGTTTYTSTGNEVLITGATGQTFTISNTGVTGAIFKVSAITGAGAGPIKSSNTIQVKIDKNSPTCNWSGEAVQTNGVWNWSKSRSISVTCSDTGGSGCLGTASSNKWTFSKTTTTSPVYYVIKDVAGNSMTCSKNANVYVDVTPPTVYLTVKQLKTDSVTLEANCIDNDSGMGTYQFSKNGESNFGQVLKTNTYTFTGLTQTTKYDQLMAKCTDAVGNSSVADSSGTTATIQTPDISITPSGYTNQDKIVKVTYYGVNINTPIYFIKGTTSGITDVALTTCSTSSSSTPKTKDECKGTAIAKGSSVSANTWYMVGSGSTVSMTVSANGDWHAVTSDGTNITSNSGGSVRGIDKGGPTIQINSTTTTTMSAIINATVKDSGAGLSETLVLYSTQKIGADVTSVGGKVQGQRTSHLGNSQSTSNFLDTLAMGRKLADNTLYYYKIIVTDKVGNETVKEGTFTTKSLGIVQITSSPSSWSKSKTIKMTGAQDDQTIQYYLSMPYEIVNDNIYPWNYNSGSDIYTSTMKESDTSSTLLVKFSITETSTFSFDWETSTESGWDYLTVYNNNEFILEASGNVDQDDSGYSGSESIELSPGDYIFKFVYEKDGSGDEGNDEVYIKNIKILTEWKDYSEEFDIYDNLTIYARITDGYNITEQKTLKITTIDKIPPKLTYSTSSTTDSVTLIANCSDSESGMGTYEFSDNGGKTWTLSSTPMITYSKLDSNVTYTNKFGVKCNDKIGNSKSYEGITVTTAAIEKPKWDYDNNEWAQSKTLTVTFDSTNVSTPFYYVYSSVNGESKFAVKACEDMDSNDIPIDCNTSTTTLVKDKWYQLSSGNSAIITIKENGYLYAMTGDGTSVSAAATATISKIDRTAPVLTLTSNSSGGNWTKNDVTVKYNIVENQSGINKCYYAYASDSTCVYSTGSWCEDSGTLSNNTFTATYGAERNTTAYMRCIDNAGNVSNVIDTSIKIDKTKPLLNKTDDVCSNGSVTHKVTITDTNAVTIKCDYINSSGSDVDDCGIDSGTTNKSLVNVWESGHAYLTKGYKVRYTVTDSVGNSSSIDMNALNCSTGGSGGGGTSTESKWYACYRNTSGHSYIAFSGDIDCIKNTACKYTYYDDYEDTTYGPYTCSVDIRKISNGYFIAKVGTQVSGMSYTSLKFIRNNEQYGVEFSGDIDSPIYEASGNSAYNCNVFASDLKTAYDSSTTSGLCS